MPTYIFLKKQALVDLIFLENAMSFDHDYFFRMFKTQ